MPEGLEVPAEGTQPALVRASMRHPVYVHSKMSIFDDDYILVKIHYMLVVNTRDRVSLYNLFLE